MRVRKTQTVADFPVEFLSAWNLAVKGELMLTMETIGAARNMIQRLYTFRKRLGEEAPHLAAPLYLVDLRVHDEAGNIIVGRSTAVPGKAIIRANTLAWKEQIRKQSSVLEGAEGKTEVPMGLRMPENLPVLVAPVESGANTSGDNLSEALSNAGYSTGEG